MSVSHNILFSTIICIFSICAKAQNSDSIIKARLNVYFNSYPTISSPGKFNNVRIDYEKRKIDIYANEGFSCIPFRNTVVDSIYKDIKQLLPGPVNYFDLNVYTDGRLIEDLIPNYFRKKKKDKSRLLTDITYNGVPWIKNISDPLKITEGLQNKHILVEQSHGKYYSASVNAWQWQRPHLYCTTEDLFTQSFILPYIIPMLQNAGAIVYTPRERDTQTNEVIVDNDTVRGHSLYIEQSNDKYKWHTISGYKGFAWRKQIYDDGDNPFDSGTSQFISTEKQKQKAFAEWVPDIPETGEYAVYVSYQSTSQSVTDAKYEVFHKGGVTEFHVNQQMGGGTWVYLGTFSFDKGVKDYDMVTLSNESKEKGLINADAVRFGGGMGNVERGGTISGLPRYLEGARYMAQWSGFPYKTYSTYKGADDYKDDINTRSLVGNYLSGGSIFNQKKEGLKVPIELSLGFHSDAGYDKNDGIVGSLAIYTTAYNNGVLGSGISRYASRDFADMMLTQVENDIDKKFNIKWTRREMWNKNYSETREPASASIILEILAHQNFKDMVYGHDPIFKFTVGRAVYKAILRYISNQHDENCVVAPLPISNFATQFGKKKNTVILSWAGTFDKEEPSAAPAKYKVYTRIGNFGFDNGVVTDHHSIILKVEPGLVYSFKVAAINKGGESFPSEILSVYKAKKERGRILIINGFDRLSGPAVVNSNTQQGFDLDKDPGVPYLKDITLCGRQKSFDRNAIGKETPDGLGFSGNELEGQVLIGNTFDYPLIHGKAIQAIGGYSFISASHDAVENNIISFNKINVIDLILGLQKNDSLTNAIRGESYKMLTPTMQDQLISFCNKKKHSIIISGAYVGSDMNNTDYDRKFTHDILHYATTGSARNILESRIYGMGCTLNIPRAINASFYPVVAPDCIAPTNDAITVFRYADGKSSAGVAWKGKYNTFVMGFPFESIQSATDRASIMNGILQFFNK